MLDYNTAKNSFNNINSSKAKKEKDDLYWKAIHYAQLRSRYALYDYSQQLVSSEERTLVHNILLDCVEKLVCKQVDLKENVTWHKEIGITRAGEDRKRIGDFACYIAMFLGLSSR